MFCPNCGKKVLENAKYCGYCGAKIERSDPAPKTQGPAFSDSAASDAVPSNSGHETCETASKPRGPRKLLVAAAVILVLLAALAIPIGIFWMPAEQGTGLQGENLYVFLSSEGYMLASDLDAWAPILLSPDQSTLPDAIYDPSGRYLYFFTNRNSSSETATLMRAEYGKLKAGSSRNSQYITRVADDVSINGTMDGEYLTFSRDGSFVFFKDANETLYSYDGEKTREIDRNAGLCWYSGQEDRLLYLVTSPDASGSSLYLADPKAPGQRTLLAQGVQEVLSHGNLNEILYTTQHPDSVGLDLYQTGINQAPVLLAEDMWSSGDFVFSNQANQNFYYAKSEDSSQIVQDTGFSLYTLYALQDGTPVPIQDKVWLYQGSDEDNRALFYCIWDTDAPMDYTMDLYDLEMTGKIKYLVHDTQTGRTVSFAQGVASRIAADYGLIEKVTLVGDDLFITCYDTVQGKRSVVAAPMDQDVISEYSLLANDGQIYCVSGGMAYYFIHSFQQDGYDYVDLYRFGENGPEFLMEDVIVSDIAVYEDGTVLASTRHSYDAGNTYIDLVMRTNQGEQVPVAADVNLVSYVGQDTLLYLSRGSLYRLGGQGLKQIARDIRWFNSKQALSPCVFPSI